MAAIEIEGRSGCAFTARKGKSLLKRLGPTLRRRGVPADSYIVVDILSGEFVTGRTREQAGQRFKSMHPGATGWMQRFGDVILEPEDLPTDAQSPNVGSRSRLHVGNRLIARRQLD
jgi:hypothetical protein